MSSASIFANMQACRQEIEQLRVSIAALAAKLEVQGSASASFKRRTSNFLEELEHRLDQNRAVSNCHDFSVLAFRYRERTADALPANTSEHCRWKLDEAGNGMKREIERNLYSLEQQTKRMAAAESTYANLQADYHHALACEAEQRRRAAEAAQGSRRGQEA